MSRQSQFAQRVYRAGLDAGLPDHLARLAATQASLETGYGKSVKGNNFFGIKAGQSWTGKRQNLTTHEEVNGKRVKIKDSFRAYDDPADSLRDWAHLLKNKFPDAYNSRNFEEAVAGLRTGVYGAYATDSKYGSKLNQINNKYVGNPQPIRVAELDGLPPARPSALSAINELAPIEAEQPPALAYQGPTPPIRPSTLPSPPQPDIGKVIADNLTLGEKIKYRKAPEVFGALGAGATKVADAFGGAGLNLFENAKNRIDGALAPTPPPRPNNVFNPMGSPSAVQTLGPAGAGLPATPLGAFANIPTPNAALQAATSAKAATMAPPMPIARPQDLDGPINPVLGARDAIKTSMPSVFNTIHDVGGQIDGFKEQAGNRIRTDISRAVYGQSGRETDRVPNEMIRHTNNYIYEEVPMGQGINGGRFRQAGKVTNKNGRERIKVYDRDQGPQGVFKRDDKPKKSIFDRLFGGA